MIPLTIQTQKAFFVTAILYGTGYLPSVFGAIYRRLEMRKRTDLQPNYTRFDYLYQLHMPQST